MTNQIMNNFLADVKHWEGPEMAVATESILQNGTSPFMSLYLARRQVYRAEFAESQRAFSTPCSVSGRL